MLFKPREHDAAMPADLDGAGAGWRAASLAHSQILDDGAPRVLQRARGWREHFDEWRFETSRKFDRLDLAPDLASGIGSRRWLRGLATMLALSAAALAFWPNMGPLKAAPSMAIDSGARDEFRSQMIMPLALGADSGRHMGATEEVIPLKSAPERPKVELLATLVQGDSFDRMLRRAGVGSADATRIGDLVQKAIPLSDIEPGTQVDITLGRRPAPGASRPLDKLAFRARFDLELSINREGGGLALERHPIRVDDTPLRIRGTVGRSLYRSARAAGAPAPAVQQYLEELGKQVDLDSGVRSTDTFDIILSYRRAATGEVQAGQLLYAGLDRGGKPQAQLMRWGKDGNFFEASGVGQQRAGLLAPVPGRITSGYGMRRHPILGYKRMHRGIDFHASYGQPIMAVADGRVLSAGRAGGCGNTVKLSIGNGLVTRFCHMSRMAVRSGQNVRRGQVIGYVGSTGLSTGPHLHYEMYRNGQSIDPRSVGFVTRAQLTGSQLKAFRARLAVLEDITPGAALAPLATKPSEQKEPEREIDKVESPRKLD